MFLGKNKRGSKISLSEEQNCMQPCEYTRNHNSEWKLSIRETNHFTPASNSWELHNCQICLSSHCAARDSSDGSDTETSADFWIIAYVEACVTAESGWRETPGLRYQDDSELWGSLVYCFCWLRNQKWRKAVSLWCCNRLVVEVCGLVPECVCFQFKDARRPKVTTRKNAIHSSQSLWHHPQSFLPFCLAKKSSKVTE